MSSDNPYEAPHSEGDAESIQGGLSVPAWSLAVLAAAVLLLLCYSLPMMLDLIQRYLEIPSTGVYAAFGVILFFATIATSNAVVLLGAIAIIRRRGYSRARWGAIIACIPILSPFYVLGIPFGIWALIALRQPVRDTFAEFRN